MLAVLDDPVTTYRRVEFDARVEGSDGAALTRLCLERAIGEIARARSAPDRTTRPSQLPAMSEVTIASITSTA